MRVPVIALVVALFGAAAIGLGLYNVAANAPAAGVLVVWGAMALGALLHHPVGLVLLILVVAVASVMSLLVASQGAPGALLVPAIFAGLWAVKPRATVRWYLRREEVAA